MLIAQARAGRAGLAAAEARCIRRCSAPAGATWSSDSTSCSAIPHKIRIGDNVVIDDNCLLDAKGDANSGHHASADGVFIGRNTILSCKNGDIDARRRREHRLQLRDVLRQPGLASARTRCWPPTAMSSAAITTSAIRSRPVLEQAALVGRCHDRRRRLDGRGREGARRRHRRRRRHHRRRRRGADRSAAPGDCGRRARTG